jgi:hypothetical protein
MTTETSVRALFNNKASEIAGVFRYLSHSNKRSHPPDWPRIILNVDHLHFAWELLHAGTIAPARIELARIRWPAPEPAP